MKAAVLYQAGAPEVLRYEDVGAPSPANGQVLIDVRAIGLQGGDLFNRALTAPRSTPHVVGYQAAGVVTATESDAFAVDDHVVAFMFAGSHAEQAVSDAQTTWKLPAGMSFEEAATVPVEFGTAHDALFEFGGLVGGETVLVQAGASGVGLAAIQLAKAAGATVLATASSAERIERLREFGADQGVDYTREDLPARIRDLTDGHGVDLVLDPVGGPILKQSLESVAYRGQVVFIGWVGRDLSPPDLMPLMLKNARLQATYFGGEMQSDPHRTHALVEGLLDRVAAGELRAHVDRVFTLSEAADAHRYVEARRAFGRVVIVP
ncbi:MAG: NADPH:quinone oxidoreductase family protein [Actinobacteria bacterium]|nr:NADPH:quinone oxidoreductase family protein [Actinomycetota bacterium]